MKTVPVPLNRHQSLTAWAMNSGPLSKRTQTGAPRSLARRSKHRATPSASMERSTSEARASLVSSSTTSEDLRASCRLWSGRAEEVHGPHHVGSDRAGRPRGLPDAPQRLLALAVGHSAGLLRSRGGGCACGWPGTRLLRLRSCPSPAPARFCAERSPATRLEAPARHRREPGQVDAGWTEAGPPPDTPDAHLPRSAPRAAQQLLVGAPGSEVSPVQLLTPCRCQGPGPPRCARDAGSPSRAPPSASRPSPSCRRTGSASGAESTR